MSFFDLEYFLGALMVKIPDIAVDATDLQLITP